MKHLSRPQIELIISALYIAIEAYEKDSMVALAGNNARLYEQFDKQAKDAKKLLAEME